MEVGKGEPISVYPHLKPDRYIKSAGFASTVVAVLGFTTILGAFSVIGVWARLACGRVVFDGPFNPTYGLSVEIRKSRLPYDVVFFSLLRNSFFSFSNFGSMTIRQYG